MIVRPPTPGDGAADPRLRQATRALETLVLKQLVTASKAFTGGEGAGSAVRADLFADALAGALVEGGGIGLARQLEASLAHPGAPAAPRVPAAGSAPALSAAATPTPLALRDGRSAGSSGRADEAEEGDAAEQASAGWHVTSGFGVRQDPLDGHLTRHAGVDLGAPEGTEVRALGAGVVRRAGPRGGYGQAVEIDHGDGTTTLYAHASQLLVAEGERVTQGQPVARVGHTGRATGPHLHLEVRSGGRPVDPRRALKSYRVRADEVVESGS